MDPVEMSPDGGGRNSERFGDLVTPPTSTMANRTREHLVLDEGS